jgi:hypothetical protein
LFQLYDYRIFQGPATKQASAAPLANFLPLFFATAFYTGDASRLGGHVIT